MLLGRQDVDPNLTDSYDDRTPLLWALEGGHEEVVKVLLERKDVDTAIPDSKNRTLLSVALSKGHDGIVKLLQERGNADSDKTNRGGQVFLQLSSLDGDKSVVESQRGGGDPNIEITDLSAKPILPPAGLDEQEGALDLISESAGDDLSSAETLKLSQPPSMLPLMFLCPRTEIGPYLHITRSTLLFVVDQYFIIAALICFSAFLIYVFPSFLPRILRFHK